MKKFLSLFLVFLLLISCFATSVNAQGDKIVMGMRRSLKLYGAASTNHKQTAENVLSEYVDVSFFMAEILYGISNCEELIEVTEYDIPATNEVFGAICDYLFYGAPEAFNINEIGCSYWENTGTMAELAFTYQTFADTESEYEICLSKMNSAANQILNGIKNNSSLSDEQKLLLLHDRLAVWNAYGYLETATEIESHTAYGALGNRVSVCQGYAMAYMFLLNKIGIENYYCSSDALNHAWNIVILDGEKYHVDVTWDDINWGEDPDGVSGAVLHDNFLRSSNGIYTSGHEAFDYDTTPNNTKYDNYFWQSSEAEFQLVNDEIYYIDHNESVIKRYGNDQTLLDISATWEADDSSSWNGNYALLSNDGSALLYSQPKDIYRFDLLTNETEKIFTPSISGQYESIYGFTYEDGNLICDIYDAPPGNYLGYGKYQITSPYTYTEDQTPDNPPEQEYVVGDVTGDNAVNNRDLGILMQYMNGWEVDINIEAADVNNDGKTNNKDYGLLMQFVNGWDIELG